MSKKYSPYNPYWLDVGKGDTIVIYRETGSVIHHYTGTVRKVTNSRIHVTSELGKFIFDRYGYPIETSSVNYRLRKGV